MYEVISETKKGNKIFVVLTDNTSNIFKALGVPPVELIPMFCEYDTKDIHNNKIIKFKFFILFCFNDYFQLYTTYLHRLI